MKKLTIFVLVLAFVSNAFASLEPFSDDESSHRRVEYTEVSINDQDSHRHICSKIGPVRYKRTDVLLTSLKSILPQLALATTGQILLEVVKNQPLTPDLAYFWVGKLYNERFLFPAALLSQQTIDHTLTLFYSYWNEASQTFVVSAWKSVPEALNITFLWMPLTIVAAGECIKTACCRRYQPERVDTIPDVKFRIICKSAGVGLVVAASAAWIIYNVGNWQWMLSYETPKVLKQMTLSGAIQLCKEVPSTGMALIRSINDTYQSLCDPSILTQYALPTANGEAWSYCKRSITSISDGNYAMLIMPLVFIMIQWLHVIWWL